MPKKIISFILITLMMFAGNVFATGNPGDYIQVGDGYLGTAAILDKADTVTATNTLPTGAAIIAWGGGGGTGYWTLSGTSIYYNDGKVGIGTATPAQQLHTYVAGTNNYAQIQSGGAYVTGVSLVNTVNSVHLQNTGLGDFRLFTAGDTRFFIGTTGKVGIGTITPGTLLEVAGIITATGGNSTNWNTAYTDRLKWDGGADNLVPATGITSLGLDSTASAITSGAYRIGVYDEFTFSNSTTVQGVLVDLDHALSTPTIVSNVRMGRARFNSTTGNTVYFSLPALDDADYDVVVSNYSQLPNVGEISIESKLATGFVLKNSGSNNTGFFEYIAIPYAFKGETMQSGTNTFNSTTGVTVTMAPVQASTNYSVIIAMPLQASIEDIGVISIESKLVGSFVVKNSGADAVTGFKWMVVPYTVAADTDQQGASTFAGTVGATVAIGADLGSTSYVILITIGTQVGIEDIGVISIESKSQTQFVVKNSGAGVTAFDWRVFPATPGTADMYRATYDADFNGFIDLAAGGFNANVSALDGLFTITAGVIGDTPDNSTDWDTAYTHSQAVTGAEHGAVVANTANMIVRRGASGEFSAGVITASLTGNVTGNVSGSSGSVTGNAATATALATPRTIGGTAFDGTANIVPSTIQITPETIDTTCFIGFFKDATGSLQPKTHTGLTFNSDTGKLTAYYGFIGPLAGAVTGNVTGNVSGSSGSCTGNAVSATILANTRTIGGVDFNGSANIVPLTITTRAEGSDTTCFIGFFNDAVGVDQPNTNGGLTFNAATEILTATGFAGPLTGAVTGNATTASHASDLVIASETQGDVLYFTGTHWTRLALGASTGKYLKAGTTPSWDVPSGSGGDITSVVAGTGLTGGGDAGGVTLNVGAGTGITVGADTVGISVGGVGPDQLASTAVTPGSYTSTNLTVDSDGRITAASHGTGGSSDHVFNVKTYGATGNGSTDDAPFINAAITAAAGKTVFFPSGTYHLHSTLNVTSKVSLMGESRYTSILHVDTNIPMITMNVNSSCSNSSIQNLGFSGLSTGSSNAGILISGSAEAWTKHCLFNNLSFVDTYYGIRLLKSTTLYITTNRYEMMFDWNVFSNITFSGVQYGIVSAYGSGTGNQYMHITGGAVIHVLSWLGGNVANIGDIVIHGAHLHTADAGFYFGSGGNYRQRISISDAQCDAGVTAFFDVHGAYGNLKFFNIMFGGGASYYFASNPTDSIIELPTGLYGYNSAGTRTTIFAY